MSARDNNLAIFTCANKYTKEENWINAIMLTMMVILMTMICLRAYKEENNC